MLARAFPSESVHPHTRGDNFTNSMRYITYYGSPPHTWGQFSCSFFFNAFCRFTPTHVGTISLSKCHRRELPVHPHTRGDNFDELHDTIQHLGSPPHTWGQCVSCTWML